MKVLKTEHSSPAGSNASAAGFAILLFLGLYLPTSSGGSYSVTLWGVYLGLLAAFLFLLLARRKGLSSLPMLVNSMMMVVLLFAASILSPFPEFRWGGLLPYLALALLFPVDIHDMWLGGRLRSWLTVINLINLAVGLGVMLHSSWVGSFLSNHYSMGTPELVPYMVRIGKPVLTFGTHSLGAFFYFLFFFLNFETYRTYKHWTSLVFALCYIGLTFALLSVTGMALSTLALFQLLRYSAKTHLKPTLALVILIAIAVGGELYFYGPAAEDWAAGAKFVSAILTSPSNGFLGRFTQSGTLYSTVQYLRNRPFTPVGIGYRGDLMFGDSGPVEYYLRGSILLVCAIYGGYFAFLRHNLLSRRHLWTLFLVTLAFETGFGSLGYFRTLYLLPVIVVYLNDLSRKVGVDQPALAASSLSPS